MAKVSVSGSSVPNSAEVAGGKEAAVCGLVMPISPIDGCGADHWSEVKQIVCEALSGSVDFEYEIRLVSDADDVGVIQKRIVQNLYSNDLVVCDVSAKNSNVMFELGMRLAFDKPTIIIKDDKTDYSFDTSLIEHIPYPRDLRFHRINEFKGRLLDKSDQTLKASKKGDYSTFLKNFGTFKVASIGQQDMPADRLMLEVMENVQEEMVRLRRRVDSIGPPKFVRTYAKGGREAIEVTAKKLLSAIDEESRKSFASSEEFKRSVARSFDVARYFDSISEFEACYDDFIRKYYS